MRHIEIEDNLRVRFPGRSSEFDDGVELGIAAALMAGGVPRFSRNVSASALDQLRSLCEAMSYRLVATRSPDGWARVTVERPGLRPALRLVSSS